MLDNITADPSNERTKKIANAERWLHNAGCHYDRAEDIEAELFPTIGGGFDDRGALSAYTEDQPLRERLLNRWRDTERPRGEQVEEAHHAYMAKVKADRERLNQAKRDHLAALDEAQEAPAA